jgi:hypothetical protein
LLNGSPEFVAIEDQAPELFQYESDRAFAPLRASYEGLMVNGGDEVFEAVEYGAGGRTSFVFQWELADGCHACAIGYWARLAIDFAKDGTFAFSRALDICRGPGPAEGMKQVEVGAAACPEAGSAAGAAPVSGVDR